jgi:alanine dehydrogenase
MLRVYAADEVHAALPWQPLVDRLAQAFVEGAEVPVRHAHSLGGSDTLLLMPAWSRRGLGVKVVTVMPGNAGRGAETVQALYLLLDRHTGVPRALIDGEALTLRRTAAASALAARLMARAEARNLLVVGTGRLAEWLARAHWATRPVLERVRVWGRRAEASEALASVLCGQGMPAQAAPDLETAVRTADLISCATTSTTPLVRGDWLAPGTHLDLVGGYRSDMREVDDAAVQRARICVDTLAGALAEAGDLLQPMRAGLIRREHVLGELADLVRGTLAGRLSAADITLFKSVGTALEDLAAAQMVVEASAA